MYFACSSWDLLVQRLYKTNRVYRAVLYRKQNYWIVNIVPRGLVGNIWSNSFKSEAN